MLPTHKDVVLSVESSADRDVFSANNSTFENDSDFVLKLPPRLALTARLFLMCSSVAVVSRRGEEGRGGRKKQISEGRRHKNCGDNNDYCVMASNLQCISEYFNLPPLEKNMFLCLICKCLTRGKEVVNKRTAFKAFMN